MQYHQNDYCDIKTNATDKTTERLTTLDNFLCKVFSYMKVLYWQPIFYLRKVKLPILYEMDFWCEYFDPIKKNVPIGQTSKLTCRDEDWRSVEPEPTQRMGEPAVPSEASDKLWHMNWSHHSYITTAQCAHVSVTCPQARYSNSHHYWPVKTLLRPTVASSHSIGEYKKNIHSFRGHNATPRLSSWLSGISSLGRRDGTL